VQYQLTPVANSSAVLRQDEGVGGTPIELRNNRKKKSVETPFLTRAPTIWVQLESVNDTHILWAHRWWQFWSHHQALPALLQPLQHTEDCPEPRYALLLSGNKHNNTLHIYSYCRLFVHQYMHQEPWIPI